MIDSFNKTIAYGGDNFNATVLRSVLNISQDGFMALDAAGNIVFANRALEIMLNCECGQLANLHFSSLLRNPQNDDLDEVKDKGPLFWAKGGGACYGIEESFYRLDGQQVTVEISAEPLPVNNYSITSLVYARDISARKNSQSELLQAYKDLDSLKDGLQKAHGQLLQSEKLASIGQLAAGVAHEINNPIGFVSSNLMTLKSQVNSLLHVINIYDEIVNEIGVTREIATKLDKTKAQTDFEFLKEDICDLIDDSLEGACRVKVIVDNLKDFSRVDSAEWQFANIEKGIDSTLAIAANELKYKADVVKRYSAIPDIECIPSQLNQVFMNLLVNAAQAIDQRGTIAISTGSDEQYIWVEIEDNGRGIPEDIRNKIFEPFFTTKPIGKGTGLGLSMSYGIIQKHRGSIEVKSVVGKGTVFKILLPRNRSEA